MKAINKIATKVAGVALATVMAVGGMTVFAAENGDQVYSDSFSVRARRSHALVYFNYTGENKTMTVSESGYYSIDFNSQDPGDYPRELFITNLTTGESVTSVCGPRDSYSIPGVYLEAGSQYDVSVYADDFMGFTILQDSGSREFTVSATLEERIDPVDIDDVVNFPLLRPGIPSMPELVIDDVEEDETPVLFSLYVDCSDLDDDEVIPSTSDIVTDTDIETTESVVTPTITPESIVLSAEQIKALSVRNFVGHLYLEGLGRNISVEETDYWVDMMLNRNVSASEVATMILTSSELTDRNMTDEEYASILNDVFDSDSEEEILSDLTYGTSLQTVIDDLAGTDAWASKCAFYGVNV
jgi:hypothetical protein